MANPMDRGSLLYSVYFCPDYHVFALAPMPLSDPTAQIMMLPVLCTNAPQPIGLCPSQISHPLNWLASIHCHWHWRSLFLAQMLAFDIGTLAWDAAIKGGLNWTNLH
jgi:hypothetical protein